MSRRYRSHALSEIQRSALAVADLALLPCGPTAAEAWARAASLETVRKALEHRPELQARLMVIRRRAGTAAARTVREVLQQSTGIPVLATELGLRQATVLSDLGDAAGARPLLERALTMVERRLGPAHPSTRIVRRNLTAVRKALGED